MHKVVDSVTRAVDFAPEPGYRRFMQISERFLFRLLNVLFVLFSLLTLASGYADQARVQTLKVPDGFEVSSAVLPGLTAYPMFITFDDRGRLYIAESTGKDLSGKEMAAAPECQILRLEDRDNDGLFDTRTVFATELSLPMGVLWHQGALFLASPPDFLRFDDSDDDGVAERRTVLLSGWNVLNTASLHGPFLGPDGLLYLTHGRHGYKIATKEGDVLEGKAARIWRCRPDGTQLERFAGGGFDNPVELIFTSSGQMLGTMTYFTDPRHGQRDALMHWVWGGVYPKPHEVTGEFIQTGPLMPVMTKFARIAPAGLLRYESDAFGDGYRGNLFSAQFNPHRIQFHKLVEHGSTYRTEDSDFLTSTDPNFYPTDLVEDADGSMLFCDTGAWYVDACPISRVAKPEIKGTIYRIRKTGAPIVKDDWGAEVQWRTIETDMLVGLLSDSRSRVRERAFQELVARGDVAVPALAFALDAATDAEARRAAVWALFQIDGSAYSVNIRNALNDDSVDVRIAAIQALSRVAKNAKTSGILDQLSSTNSMERREAATALGVIGDKSAASALLAACAHATDRFEEHAIVFALIESADQAALLNAVETADEPSIRKAALIALDQLHSPSLTAEHAVPLLTSASADARQAGLWVASHHPDWSGVVLGFVADVLKDVATSQTAAAMAREILTAYSATVDAQAFVAAQIARADLDLNTRLFLMDVIDTAPVAPMPKPWRDALGDCLQSEDWTIQHRAIAIAGNHSIEELGDRLATIADNVGENSENSLFAISALTQPGDLLEKKRFDFVLGELTASVDPSTRQEAARILGRSKLDSAAKLMLANDVLSNAANVLVLSSTLPAFTGETDPAIGAALVDALVKNADIPNLLTASQLDRVLAAYPASVHLRAQPLKARLEQRDARLMERFLQLEPRLGAGDVGRGRAIFFGEKALCSTCHAIGSEGGRLGPDLTTIGLVRSGHDLLESIMFPSASMVPDYQPVTTDIAVEKPNGEAALETITGIVIRETADTVTLMTSATETRTLPREHFSASASALSLMPEGLDAAFSDDEMLDLIAFLRSLNNEEWLLPETRN